MKKWTALFAAIGMISVAFLLRMIFRSPKYDAIIAWNSPRVYVPGLAVIFVLQVLIVWQRLRKP